MRVIIFILVLIFVFFDGRKAKNQKKPPNKKPPAAKPTADGAIPEGESIPRMVDDPAPEGLAVDDDEGCLGGSMEHHDHEGESRVEHRRHMAAIIQREDEEIGRQQAARELSDLNTRRLRQAVIMAEVLDRPVALRGRRARGAR